MAIEFPCSQCGKMLRVGDDAAGKQARCPSCGALQGIPAGPTLANPFGATAPTTPQGGETNPYQAPLDLGTEMPTMPSQAGSGVRPTIINFSDPINSTWRICSENFLLLVMCLVAMIICVVVNYAGGIAAQVIMAGVNALGPPVALVVTVSVVVNLALFVLQTWIGVGQSLFFLKTARGEEASLGILFAGGPYLAASLLATVIIAVAVFLIGLLCGALGLGVYFATKEPLAGVAAGLPFFVIAALYISLTYFPCGFLVADQGLGALDALRVSKDLTTGNRLTLFALFLVAGLAATVSILLCCLPYLITLPFIVLTATITYLKMAGQVTADQLPAPHKTETPFASESQELR